MPKSGVWRGVLVIIGRPRLALRITVLTPARRFLPALVLVLLASPVHAQGKLEAEYKATLAGFSLGKGTWQIDVADTGYTVALDGKTTGMLGAFTTGQGNSSVRGTFANSQPVAATYASTIKMGKKNDEVRMIVNSGAVKEFDADPPPKPDPERIPVTDADRRGVTDPLTAALMRAPGNSDPVSSEACRRTLSIFDGRMRYDIKLSFKRMDQVKIKGYEGAAVVCAVNFKAVAGYNPTRYAIKYLQEQREIEAWLAPIAGTRVLVPIRIHGPTPVGEAVLEATRFVTVAAPKPPLALKTQ